MISGLILTGSVIGAAAVSLPFTWTDRGRKGPLFRASLAILFALVSFGAVVAGLAPGATGAGVVEVAGMIFAGAFIFSALEKLGPDARLSPWVFTAGGVLTAIAFWSMLWSDARSGWDSVAAGFWAGCNVGGLATYAARGGKMRRAPKQARPVLLASFAFAVVNLAQVARAGVSGPEGQLIILAGVPIVLAVAAALASRELAVIYVAPSKRYKKSGVSEASARDLFGRIERLMAEKTAFADPDLDRDGLAALLGVDARSVSEALNRAGNERLAAYLRRLRLAEAQRLLRDPTNAGVSLEAIGMLAGFRSRSSFYAAFEEAFGETPGAWRERLKS